MTIHDLRRRVGFWLAQDRKSLHLIGDVLNHRDPKTTAGYAYFQTQHRRDALTGHGNRVLALCPTNLCEAAVPRLLSAAALLGAIDTGLMASGGSRTARHRHYFKREDL